MDLTRLLDLAMALLGLLGFIGTLRGWPFFMNEARMQNLIATVGRRRMRIAVAAGYLLVGLLGLVRLVA